MGSAHLLGTCGTDDTLQLKMIVFGEQGRARKGSFFGCARFVELEAQKVDDLAVELRILGQTIQHEVERATDIESTEKVETLGIQDEIRATVEELSTRTGDG